MEVNGINGSTSIINSNVEQANGVISLSVTNDMEAAPLVFQSCQVHLEGTLNVTIVDRLSEESYNALVIISFVDSNVTGSFSKVVFNALDGSDQICKFTTQHTATSILLHRNCDIILNDAVLGIVITSAAGLLIIAGYFSLRLLRWYWSQRRADDHRSLLTTREDVDDL